MNNMLLNSDRGLIISKSFYQIPMSPVSSLTTASCPVASNPLALWWSTGTSSKSLFTATTTTRTSLDYRTNTSAEGLACSTPTSLMAMPPCSSRGSKFKTRADTSVTRAHERATRRSLSTWRWKVSSSTQHYICFWLSSLVYNWWLRHWWRFECWSVSIHELPLRTWQQGGTLGTIFPLQPRRQALACMLIEKHSESRQELNYLMVNCHSEKHNK